jgi:hypothetical protein
MDCARRMARVSRAKTCRGYIRWRDCLSTPLNNNHASSISRLQKLNEDCISMASTQVPCSRYGSLSELCIYFLKVVEEALEQLHTQSWTQVSSCRSNTMHAELRDPSIDSPQTNLTACHGPGSSSTVNIVLDLKDLSLGSGR